MNQSLARRRLWSEGRTPPVQGSPPEATIRIEALDAARRFHDELHEEMAGGTWGRDPAQAGSLHHIVSCLARHLNAPVVLQDRNLLTLAEAGTAASSIALSPGRHQTILDVVVPLTRAGATHELRPLGPTPRRLVVPVRGGGDVVGFLVTTATRNQSGVRRALECAAGFVALERLIRTELEAAQELDRETLLGDLISGHCLHRLVHRGLRAGVDLRRAHFPCVFAATPPSPGRAAQLRTLVLDAVGASPSGVLGVVLDDLVVALVPETWPGGVGAVCDRVIAGARDVSFGVRAGVGPLCRELTDYEQAVHKARWVTEVLAAVGGGDWATFDDLGVYAILFDREQATQLDEFVARQLGALMSYDEMRKADLVETLRCVLDAGGVMTDAAKQLHLHISTLKYRVHRIEELLDVDLRNPQAAFNLQLACKILGIRCRLAGGGPGLSAPETGNQPVGRTRDWRATSP